MDIILAVLLERVAHLVVRPIIYILFTTWGWIIIGVLLTLGGFIYGHTSHQVSYQYIDHVSLTPYFVKDGTDYFQVKNSSIYYVFNENDFSPNFKRNVFFSSGGFTFIARTDAENVDKKFSDGTHLTGSGYKVEEITFFSSDGQPQQVFSTPEFSQYPQGFYEDHWMIGRILIYIGIFLSIAALFLTIIVNRKK